MKSVVIFATLLAALNAQSTKLLVRELVSKVYQVSDDGRTHTINAAPYLQAVYKFLGEGYESEIELGNENGVITVIEKADWTDRNHFHYTVDSSGKAGNHPLAKFGLYPAEVHEDVFESTAEFKLSKLGMSFKDSGRKNGHTYTQEAKLDITRVGMTRSFYNAEIYLTQSSYIPSSINKFWQTFAKMPSGLTTIVFVAEGKKACIRNLLNTYCEATLIANGNRNGKDLGKTSVRYNVRANHAGIAIKHKQKELFAMHINGIHTMEVLSIKYRTGGDQRRLVLAIQFVGPAGMVAVADAGRKFIAPFGAFFSAIKTMNDFNHAVVYSDDLFKAAQGQDYFNLYPIFQATKFESDVLPIVLAIDVNMQSAAKRTGELINERIEGMLQNTTPLIVEVRTYVQGLISANGKAQFDYWFAQIKLNH